MLIYPDKVVNHLRDWLFTTAKAQYRTSLAVVLTGGVDSLLTTILCLQASPELHTHIICMDFADIEKTKTWLSKTFSNFSFVIPKHPEMNMAENIDVRTSMIPAYVDLIAKQNNSLTVGSINRSEYSMVKFYKRVDDIYDCFPIIDLYRSEVLQLLKHLSVPDIYNTKSLIEESFGFSFDDLEWLDREDANLGIITSATFPNKIRNWGIYNIKNKALIDKVFKLHKQNKCKEILSSKMCLVRKSLPGSIT